MKYSSFPHLFRAGFGAILLFSTAHSSLKAAFVREDFNNYGTSATSLTGLNGGLNWTNAFSVTGTPAPRYVAGSNLSYSSALGYINYGEADANDGAADNNGNITSTGTIYSSRNFVSGTISSGTLWISALTQYNTTSAGLVSFLQLDAGTIRLGIQGNQLRVNQSGTNLATSTVTGAANTTHLMIYKFELNYSGNNERVSGWLDPLDVTSEAALSTPHVSYIGDLSGAFGGQEITNTMRLSLKGNVAGDVAVMDSIRLSFGADSSLMEVVPEPGVAQFLLLGTGLMLVGSRFRSRRHAELC